MRDRLRKSDWLAEGVRALSNEGPGALKAARIAARLGVSRGSFYWHFRDVADFKRQLLASWRERTTDRVIRDLDAREAKPDRLKDLLRRAMAGKRSRLEQAVRLWAAEDRNVASAIAVADASRIAYIAELLVECQVARASAMQRATFLYWAFLGQAVVLSRRHAIMSIGALEELAALFERR